MAGEDIAFSAQNAVLRGWFYPPSDRSRTSPCIVLQTGFSGVKEMATPDYAEVLQAAGFACLVYDHPGFGASDALPQSPPQEIDPWQQVRCIQDAISYAQSRPEVDPDRIGLWGTSFAGGHAIVVAAGDRRVKAVVTQLPLISGSRTFDDLVPIGARADLEATFAAERRARFAGADPTLLPVVAADPTANAALSSPGAYEYFTELARSSAPAWRNEVTLSSMELLRAYEPGAWIRLVAPTPLLIVAAPGDHLADGRQVLAAYEEALHPKKLVSLPGGHFDQYSGTNFDRGSAATRDWFVEHLFPTT
ncbi:alpha/beta hydrolase [Actinomycetospora flava]|uniref:Alpha/beta fold hydrolase n=1 Tax=Actinomycetospora flava TaxID=3129232 RepID=A0ABU8MAH2_9PSEU